MIVYNVNLFYIKLFWIVLKIFFIMRFKAISATWKSENKSFAEHFIKCEYIDLCDLQFNILLLFNS